MRERTNMTKFRKTRKLRNIGKTIFGKTKKHVKLLPVWNIRKIRTSRKIRNTRKIKKARICFGRYE